MYWLRSICWTSFGDYDSNDDDINDSADEVAHNTATGQTDRVVVPPLDELTKLRHPLTKGEALVLDFFLRNLPKSWEIYIQPHLNGLEPDFILLHPKRGIAVYEVRDWKLESSDVFMAHSSDGSLTLMERKDGVSLSIEKENPVTQVDLCKDEIYSLYCPRLPSRAGFGVITAGVIFPFATVIQLDALFKPLRDQNGHSSKPSLYPLVGSDILNSTNKWSFRARVLPSVQSEDDRINEDRAADLRRWLLEPLSEGLTQRTLLDDLNPRQKKLVTTRTTSGYRRIKGCAGSGKSFVLAGRAAWLASGKDDEAQARKKKVLIITYNITLINYLLDLAVQFNPSGKVRDQITALNFHYWCKRVARESGRLLQEKGLTCIHTFGVGNSKIERHYDSQRRKIAFSKGIPFIKITTVQSFKGWESRALVVHAGNRTSPSALALVYVAITRLKRDVNGSYLTVVSASPHLLSYGETWPDFKNLTTVSDSANDCIG